MKVAIEIYVSLFILCLTMALCVGFISSDLTVMEARDCYYSYVNELQESNFADSVVTACIDDAAEQGHSLSIDILEDGNGNRSANVVLSYQYKVLPLGISQNKSIRGYIN